MSTDAPPPLHTVDVRGMACPIPVIRTAKTIRGLAQGDVVEILATDPGVEADMQAWSRQTGNELISIEQTDGTFRVLVRKSR